jgi:hypothetical protein
MHDPITKKIDPRIKKMNDPRIKKIAPITVQDGNLKKRNQQTGKNR